MEYRVVEIDTHLPPEQAKEVEVARFDSAYHAADFITASWYRGEVRSARLHVVDSQGSILLSPYDLVGIRPGAWM